MTTAMPSSSIIAFPQAAPASTSMVMHSLRCSEKDFLSAFEQQGQSWRRLKHDLDGLFMRLTQAREQALLSILDEIQRRGSKKLPLKWFKKLLAEQLNNKPLVREPAAEQNRLYSSSYVTLRTWAAQTGLPIEDIDTLVTLFVMGSVDTRKQGFLPSHVQEYEPHWWCYAKTSPTASVLPCPWPLLPDLPQGTIVFTDYPSFAPGWTWLRPPWIAPDASPSSFVPIGAIRFSSQDINYSVLSRWDPTLIQPEAQLIFGDRKQHLSTLAERILYQVASEVFSSEVYPPQLPFVYDRFALGESLTSL